MTERLTIVLPLKGRSPWTFRFLAHAEKLRFPYRLLVADGEVDEVVAEQLSAHRKLFPHVNMEYVQYPDDQSLKHFFRKMADACNRIRTPYAMLADNDDFLCYEGIERALDFLDKHPDYVCARGQILAFSLMPLNARGTLLEGRPCEVSFQYNIPGSVAELPSERLRAGLNLGNYYAVCRAGSLAAIFNECTEIGFSDYMLHESFHSMRLSTFGKSHVDESAISYFRQMRTSSTYLPGRDWARHLLDSTFTTELEAMTNHISAAAARTEGVGKGLTDELVRCLIENYLREFLFTEFSLATQIRRCLSRSLPKFVGRARDRWARLRYARVRRLRAVKAARGNLATAGAFMKHLEDLEHALFSISNEPSMIFARRLAEGSA